VEFAVLKRYINMSMKISVVVNCDNRPENNNFTGSNLGGCVNDDFLIEGIKNKVAFFEGFDIETIIYLDKHKEIPYSVLRYLEERSDCFIARTHTHEPSFNDWNFIRALQMATGDIVVKIDQDTALFRNGKEYVDELLNYLNVYAYVSYPSWWTPDATHDPNYNYKWVSTRFFMCKRETLNFHEIIKCLTDYEYFCDTYKPSRVNPWLEHFLGLISKSSVIYPPIELDKGAIFSWGSYKQGTLQMLNNMPYEEVKKWIEEQGNIQYPNDVFVR
jgi:hypothetical protein